MAACTENTIITVNRTEMCERAEKQNQKKFEKEKSTRKL